MKKVGLLGLGNKPESVLRFMKKSKIIDLVGIYEPNAGRINSIAENLKINLTTNPFGLIAQSDLLIIPKVDENSYNLIIESILNSKHVVIENPLALTVKELEELIKLSSEASVSIVPFLPYRFNNCLLNTRFYVFNPLFIETSCTYAPKAKISNYEKSENLLNLIDIILNLVKANVKRIQANSARITGNLPQLISCRIEFDNGCIACLLIKYISRRDELFCTIYQSEQIIDIDLIKNCSTIKTFSKDDIMKFEVRKPPITASLNIYESIISYLETFEINQSQINLMETFKNSIDTLKKVEDKIAH